MPAKPQITEYDDAVLRVARRLSLVAEYDRRLKGRWPLKTLSDAVQDELGVGLPRSPMDGPVGRLIECGEIVQYPATERIGNGRARVYRAASVDELHLGTLMRLAAETVDPNLKGKRGRKGHAAEARHAEKISPAQYAKIRTMARHIAFNLVPTADTEEEAYEGVRGAYLMWDPAEGLEGDWRPIYDLVRASRPPAKRVADDLSAAKTLLDLAATHGFLLRAARSESYVVPTSWTEVQERWADAARHDGVAAVLAVNYFLGAIAEVLGPDADPEALTREQVERVVEHVQDGLLTDRSLKTGQRTSIRRSIRRLMDAGLVPRVDVNGWDYRQRHRMAAWSSTVTTAIAATVASEHRGLGLDRKEDGYAAWAAFPFPVLADPRHPYSLARAVDFHCAKGRERDRLGLRGLGSYPLEPARGNSNLTVEYWAEATVRMRLGSLAMYIGWIRRHTRIDLETASLADLLTPELVLAYVDAVDAGEWSTPDQARRALVTIGLITSPCLQDEALKAGDDESARQFFAVSCLATGKGRRDKDGRYDGRPLYKQLDERDDVEADSVRIQKAEAEAVEAAYRTVLGVDWAYDGMVAVYEAARASVLRSIGVRSTAELRERWDALILRPTGLEHLRSLAIWNLSLAAPLRTSTQRLLETGMIVDHHGRRLDLAAPAKIFKVEGNGDYYVNLWSVDGAGGFDIDLMRTYLMPGGARDRLLGSSVGRRAPQWLWVNSFARGNTRRAQVLDSTLNLACKIVIELAAPELRLSTDQVDVLHAVAQIHSFRHAIAGRLVADGRIEDARVLLHHKGYDTLHGVYASNNRNVSTAGLRAEIAAHSGNSDLMALVRRATPEELEEIRRLLEEDAV